MNTELSSAGRKPFCVLARAAAILAAAVGALTLALWLLGDPVLHTRWPGFFAMKANTAFAFLLAGLSLWLLQPGPAAAVEKSARQRPAQLLALVVAIIGSLTLVQYLFRLDFGIDQLLVRDAGAAAFPGRMSPHSALGFVLVGIALLLLDRRTRRGRRPAQFLALIAVGISYFGLIGSLYGSTYFYGLSSATRLAMHSIISVLLLSVGILFARGDVGVLRTVFSDSGAGASLRRLLPPAIAVPPALGWLWLLGRRANLYDREMGAALFVLASVLILALMIWANAKLLDRAAQTLHASEERFRGLIESAPDAMVIVDRQGAIVLANARAENMFDYSRNELLSQKVEMLMPERFRTKHPAHRERFFGHAQMRPMGAGLELYALRKNGTEFPVEISLSPLQTSDGEFVTSAIRDITERKKVEAEILLRSAQLEAANKELEAFSFSVSHDLRAPLRSIDGFSHALLEDCAGLLDEQGKAHLRRIRAATQRMGALIDDLLNLSRVTRAEMRTQRLNLSVLARSIAAELQKTRAGRHVEFVIQDGLETRADPRLLRLVFENLLGNAWKFTEKRHAARIELGRIQVNGASSFFVRDNGAGFDPRYADRLFSPFQRLHAASEFPGTGIGLALVQRIIQRHGGRIWAESAVDQGATFYFTLAEDTF